MFVISTLSHQEGGRLCLGVFRAGREVDNVSEKAVT